MLTANLIRDIDKGIAQVKTFVWAVAGSARLPVPRNSRIVITDLLICPFINEKVNAGITIVQDNARTFEYRFTSSMGRSSFVLRHQFFSAFTPSAAPAVPFFVNMEAPIHINTYLVHSEEVRLNCFMVTPVGSWLNTFAPLDDVSGEPAPPVGYGTLGGAGLPVSKLITLGAGSTNYVPAGIQNTPSGVSGASYVEQFGIESKGASALLDPTTLGHNNSFPIVNISYVLYENMITPNVKGN